MLSDPMNLYKLMNLYMLRQVNYPLSNSQLTDFFLAHEYTTYFTLQQALSELTEAGLIKAHSNYSMTRYEITREGMETLDFFGSNISADIREDMDRYLKDNQFKIRNEAGILADYYLTSGNDYMVHLEIREGKSPLLDLSLSVPDKQQAESICSRWEKQSQEVYSWLVKTLVTEAG